MRYDAASSATLVVAWLHGVGVMLTHEHDPFITLW